MRRSGFRDGMSTGLNCVLLPGLSVQTVKGLAAEDRQYLSK